MNRKAHRKRGSEGVRLTGRRKAGVVLAAVVLGGLAIVVVVLSNRPHEDSTGAEQASDEGIAGEFAEQAEQARGREEAL